MADNLTLNAGSGGATLATDDVSAVHYQEIKIVDGTKESTTPAAVGGGVEANALRVTIASDSTGVVSVDDNGGSLTIDGTVTANLSATDNAVLDQIEVNTSYGDQTGGGVEASALRVTLASDSTGVLSIDDNGGSITVDGTVTANLSATDNAVLDQIEVNTSYGDQTGGGAEASALRVTLANDSTGLISVDDNGGSLTVDNGGTFAVQSTLQTGSNLVGDVGISGARTSGGTTLYKNIDVDETEDQVKATAGQLYWIHAINLGTTVRYLKIYNATAATVVVGTTVPDLTFPIPTQGDANGAGFALSVPNGIAFGTAITIAATTGVADADTGAPGANEVIVNLGYA